MSKQVKIALLGKARSGKDSVANILVGDMGFREFKLSKGIYDFISQFYRARTDQVDGGAKDRGLLQLIGQTVRKIDEDIWIDYLLEDISSYPQWHTNRVVVSDVRQANEVDALRNAGYTIIKVTASENTRIARMKAAGDIVTKEQLSYETELSVDALDSDWVIVNEGTLEELTKAVEDVVAKIETGGTNK